MEALIEAVRKNVEGKSFVIVSVNSEVIFNESHKSDANCVSGIVSWNSLRGFNVDCLSKNANATEKRVDFLNDEVAESPEIYSRFNHETGETIVPEVKFYFFEIKEMN